MGWAKGRWYENYKNLKHNATNNEQLEEKKQIPGIIIMTTKNDF